MSSTGPLLPPDLGLISWGLKLLLTTPGSKYLNASTLVANALFLTSAQRRILRGVVHFTENHTHGSPESHTGDSDPLCRPGRPPHRPHALAQPDGHRRHRPLRRHLRFRRLGRHRQVWRREARLAQDLPDTA